MINKNKIYKIIILSLFIASALMGIFKSTFIIVSFIIFIYLPKLFSKDIKYPDKTELILIFLIITTLILEELYSIFSFKLFQIFSEISFGITIAFISILFYFILNKNTNTSNSKLLYVFTFTTSITLYLIWINLTTLIMNLFELNYNSSLTKSISFIYVIIGILIIITNEYFHFSRLRNNFFSKFYTSFRENNPLFFKRNEEDIIKIIENGENDNVEFKETLRTNLHTKEVDNNIENSVLKNIVAFLNTNGGTIFVGIDDEGNPKGLAPDNFQSNDKLHLHLINIIKKRIGENFTKFINASFYNIKGYDILVIECFKSSIPVFLSFQGKEDFYIRIGPSASQLKGSNLIQYIKKKNK